MQTPVNVICMKWGKLYGPEYVNFLRAGVGRHLKRPFRFVCFTDDANGLRDDVQALPLPELGLPKGQGDLRWRKLAVFRKELYDLRGTTLFLDLDLVIVDSIDPFFESAGQVPDHSRRRPVPAEAAAQAEPGARSFPAQRGQFLGVSLSRSASTATSSTPIWPTRRGPRYEISQQFQSAQLAAHRTWPTGRRTGA